MFNIRWENFLLKKRLHHFFEIILPFGTVWFGFMFVLIPGMQVGEFVNGSYQESVRI